MFAVYLDKWIAPFLKRFLHVSLLFKTVTVNIKILSLNLIISCVQTVSPIIFLLQS